MSVFELERNVTLGYSCELCLFIKRPCHWHKRAIEASAQHRNGRDLALFIWRGQPSLRRIPVTSRENPFDVKVHSKPTDGVFSCEWPGFELQSKGEIATAEVKRVSLEAFLSHSSTWSVFFLPFRVAGLLWPFLHPQLWHLQGIPHFFWLSFLQLKNEVWFTELASCRSSPIYFSPPFRWLKVHSSGDDSSCFSRDVSLIHATRA